MSSEESYTDYVKKGDDFVQELEEWRPFGPPYDDITEGYLVSNFGRVMDSKTGRILRQQESSDGLGYYRVRIRNSRLSTKLEMVHRLVASAFVEGYQREKVVNHIDCNPSNNRADNLEWITQTENLRYRSPETLFKKYKPVYSFDKQGRLERVYASQELTKKDGHYPSRVSSASKHNNVIHHNLYWGVVGDKLWETKYKDVFENDILYFLVDW